MDPDSIAPSLSAPQLERLLLSSTHEQHPAGTVLFREGDLGDAMYVIDWGDVQIFHEDASGATMALRRLGPGQMFGEFALIERGGRRLAGARTLTDARLRRISREAFEALLDEARPLRQRLLGRREDHLLGALRRRSALVRALAQTPVQVRVRELAAATRSVRTRGTAGGFRPVLERDDGARSAAARGPAP